MLGREEDFLVSRHGLFERADAGFAPDHEGGHHERENDDVPNGHHRESFGVGFFFRGQHVSSAGTKTAISLTIVRVDRLEVWFFDDPDAVNDSASGLKWFSRRCARAGESAGIELRFWDRRGPMVGSKASAVGSNGPGVGSAVSRNGLFTGSRRCV